MNKVEINAEKTALPSWSGSMCCFALKVLKEIKKDNWELSILLCDDKTITRLNTQYRNIPEPTDILSFSLDTEVENDGKIIYLPGDIVISLDTLRENAEFFKTTEDEELRRTIIHGILHLDGMNHESTDKNEPMLVLQEEILNKLKDEVIISHRGENGGKN